MATPAQSRPVAATSQAHGGGGEQRGDRPESKRGERRAPEGRGSEEKEKAR
jgi:hypothetical protein